MQEIDPPALNLEKSGITGVQKVRFKERFMKYRVCFANSPDELEFANVSNTGDSQPVGSRPLVSRVYCFYG